MTLLKLIPQAQNSFSIEVYAWMLKGYELAGTIHVTSDQTSLTLTREENKDLKVEKVTLPGEKEPEPIEGFMLRISLVNKEPSITTK